MSIIDGVGQTAWIERGDGPDRSIVRVVEAAGGPTALANSITAVISELDRISEFAENRLADAQSEIESLRREIALLRRAAVHLRHSRDPLPVQFQPVMARAHLMVRVEDRGSGPIGSFH